MSQYVINEDGSTTTMSRYSRKGIKTLMAIFPESVETTKKYLKKKKSAVGVWLQDKYKLHDNSALVRKIFYRFLLKVLARVANGDLFIMPGTTQANIALKQIPDKEVKLLRSRGFYDDYDIVRAGFKIPRFALDFGPRSRRRDLQVYVPPSLQLKALKNAENKRIQWTYLRKTFNDDDV